MKRNFLMMLRHRFLPLFVAVVSLVLTLPALKAGWQLDDYIHRVALLGPSHFTGLPSGVYPTGGVTELFRFSDGDPQHTCRCMDAGLPWWSDPQLRLAFFRPLTALTHQIDYRLWPDFAPLMHLHSMMWLAALVFTVALFYRRFMGLTAAAGLAALLFAVDDTHGIIVGFLASRNTLLAALFGILAVLAHDNGRSGRWRYGIVVGTLLFVLSLLSAEAGVATLAYLIAYEVCLDKVPWRLRIQALLPYAGFTILWRLAWSALGFGANGSGYYIDPGTQPLRYLIAMVSHVPVLLLGQWTPLSADLSLLLSPQAYQALWVLACCFLIVLALILLPLFRRDALARFFTLGMLLALAPICATFPTDRLLIFVGVGAMGLLARFLGLLWQRETPLFITRLQRTSAWALAGLLILFHGLYAPLALPSRAGPMRRIFAQLYINTPLDAAVERQSVVVVNGPMPLFSFYLQAMRAVQGLPIPHRVWSLFAGFVGTVLMRTDSHTLVIRPEGGYLRYPVDTISRDPQIPFHVGDRIQLTGLSIEVTALTPDNRPAEITCRFAVPLEDSSLRWICWKAGRFQPFVPPAIGTTVRFAPVALTP